MGWLRSQLLQIELSSGNCQLQINNTPMPTPAHPHVLPLEPLPADINTILSEITSKLEEVRNFGTFVLAWVGQEPPPDALRLAPLFILRHALEQLDAICILVKNGAPDAAMVNLRALMETWLYILYMTESDTDKRAAAYLVWYFHERQKTFRQFLPGSQGGIESRAELAGDRYSPGLLDGVPFETVEKAIANIDAILAQPEYLEMETMYQELMAGPRNLRPKSWYQLAGGPNNIRGLTRELRVASTYIGVYKRLSGVVHGGDIIAGRISRSEPDGMAAVRQLRLLSNLKFVATKTIRFSKANYRHLVGRYAPSKESEVRRWYLVEMREFMKQKLPTLDIQYL